MYKIYLLYNLEGSSCIIYSIKERTSQNIYINVFHINTEHAYYHAYRMHNQLAHFCLQTGG